MEKTKYPLKVKGLLNSIIHPLLSSLILLDDLIHEIFEDQEILGRLLEIDNQVQSAAKYFLELRFLTSLEVSEVLRTRSSSVRLKK